jgi:hypothetical protein
VAATSSTTTVPDMTTTSAPACKPGWGWGDKNHCHAGPPGLATPDNHTRDIGAAHGQGKQRSHNKSAKHP